VSLLSEVPCRASKLQGAQSQPVIDAAPEAETAMSRLPCDQLFSANSAIPPLKEATQLNVVLNRYLSVLFIPIRVGAVRDCVVGNVIVTVRDDPGIITGDYIAAYPVPAASCKFDGIGGTCTGNQLVILKDAVFPGGLKDAPDTIGEAHRVYLVTKVGRSCTGRVVQIDTYIVADDLAVLDGYVRLVVGINSKRSICHRI
jgi:hypothetical protein